MALLPFENANDKSHLALRDKIALFGDSAIPLIFPWASKGKPLEGPFKKYCFGWTKRTREETLLANYLADLYSEVPHNVGMRQGGTTGLGAFDFDTEEPWVWEEFIEANPRFKENALITVGARGFTLWILFEGDFPQSHKSIVFKGPKEGEEKNESAVEWRTQGNHSLIHGRHNQKNLTYRIFVIGKGLLPVKWAELRCPGPRWKPWPKLYEPTRESVFFKGAPPSSAVLAKRLAWIEETYGIIEREEGDIKVRVPCPTQEAHTNQTRDEDTVIFTGADGTTPNFYCAHNHCKDTNKEETRKVLDAFLAMETVVLADDTVRFRIEVGALYEKLAAGGKIFCRNDSSPFSLCYWYPDFGEPLPLNTETFNFLMGELEIAFARFKYNKLARTKAKRTEIEEILAFPGALGCQRALSFVRTPMLVKTAGGARLLSQAYCPESKTIILGAKEEAELLSEVGSIKEARELLIELTGAWRWNSEADRGRAIAELLTQALLAGGFIERPIPAFLTLADGFAAGKTFWHKVVGWIYGEEVDSDTCNDKGRIGGFEEKINEALYNGKNFFLIDELEGSIKSALVNALLTGASKKTVRIAYKAFSEVAVNRFILMLAGVKGFSIEEQMASRIIPIRMIRVPGAESPNYQWSAPGGGELMNSWVMKNATRILGAIYRVILEWERAGYPLAKPDGRFPSWNMAVDEILVRILGFPRTGDGLEEMQKDLSCDVSGWINDIFEKLDGTHYVWSGNGDQAYHLSMEQLRKLLMSEGLGIPGADPYLRNDSDRRWNQLDCLRRAIERLNHSVPDTSGNMMFWLGEQYVFRIRKGNKRNSRPNYVYLLSRVMDLPGGTEPVPSEDDIMSFGAN